MGLRYFFSETTHHSLSITRREHLEASTRHGESLSVTPLHAAGQGTHLKAQMIEFPAGASVCPTDECSSSNGLVYVLEGKLKLDAGGMEEELESGDCVYMESEMPLAMSALGKQRCRVLSVTPASAG